MHRKGEVDCCEGDQVRWMDETEGRSKSVVDYEPTRWYNESVPAQEFRAGEESGLPCHLKACILHLQHFPPTLSSILSTRLYPSVFPAELHESSIRVEHDQMKIEFLDQVELHFRQSIIVRSESGHSHLCGRKLSD